MFTSKYLIIALVIVIILAGGFFWYSSQVIAPETAPPPSSFRGPVGPPSINGPTEPPPQAGTIKTWTVEYKGGAYLPNEITVKKGDKVIWINRDSQLTWPASAIHPTHQVYPGFDALRGLAIGEQYSFVFDRVGSWRYHDHLNPSITGTVNVMEQ